MVCFKMETKIKFDLIIVNVSLIKIKFNQISLSLKIPDFLELI